MNGSRRHSWLVGILTTLSVLFALAGCNGDDEEEGPGAEVTATASPTSTPSDPMSPQVGGIEAAARYLRENGLEGRTGELSDPRDCRLIEDDPGGEFCVHENFSVYAPGLVILVVANAADPEEEIYQLRIRPGEDQWNVTEVNPFGIR